MSMNKHVTEQFWRVEEREDGIYLICEDDKSTVLKLCCPDRGSDLFMAGYITGLQIHQLQRKAGS